MFDLDEKKMTDVVSSFQIPVKPQILTDMQSVVSEAEPDMDHIAQIISRDVGLSSAILKIINSPFWSWTTRNLTQSSGLFVEKPLEH